jgi:hypothetical protein
MGGMRRRRTEQELLDEQVLRDAEQSLVAALQESDTAVEALQDADAVAPRVTRRWRVGIAGLVLATLGLVVARRRR